MKPTDDREKLHKKIQKLQSQLDEANAIIKAIRVGQVDAFFVNNAEKNEQVLALEGAEHPYRVIVESMYEGAISIIYDGTITYSNAQFSKFLGLPIDEVVGTSIYQYLDKNYYPLLTEYIKNNDVKQTKFELPLKRYEHSPLTVYFTASKLQQNGAICIAVTDISELKANELALKNAIADLKITNEELQKALHRAEEASKAKSEFLANMSHELRSPLNAIIGFTELIYDDRIGPISTEQKDYLKEVLTSSRQLLSLINQVLDLSRIQANRMEFIPEKISLNALVSEVANDFKLAMAEKKLNFATTIDPGLNNIVLDPVRLKQVLYNLLSNAIKFSYENGSITVNILSENENSFRVEVKDTGIGIKEAEINKLFVPFQQLDAGTAKQYQGSGLGLAITKKIVEAQGGSIGVSSIFGKGSTFYFTLPRMTEAINKYELIN